jgi:hypothetical protein
MGNDFAVALSDDGLPTALAMYGSRSTPALEQLINKIRDAQAHKTARLGESLAPYAVRYLVVVERRWAKGAAVAVPDGFKSALLDQLDLRELEVTPGVMLFENTRWVPTYAAVAGRPQVDTASYPGANGSTPNEADSKTNAGANQVSLDLSGAQAVLFSNRTSSQLADDASAELTDPEQARLDARKRRNDLVAGTELRGRVPPISTLSVAVAADGRWRARGATLASTPVTLNTGTMAFAPTGISSTGAGNPAVVAGASVDVVALEYQSSPLKRLLRGIEGVLWLVAMIVLFRTRKRDRLSREQRLLEVERLAQADAPTLEFGESLGWIATDPDFDDPLANDELLSGIRIAAAPAGRVSKSRSLPRTVRSRTSTTSGSTTSGLAASDSTASGSAASGSETIHGSPQDTNAPDLDVSTETLPSGLSDGDTSNGSVPNTGSSVEREIEDMVDGSLADSMWESWSKRRGDRK